MQHIQVNVTDPQKNPTTGEKNDLEHKTCMLSYVTSSEFKTEKK